LAALYGQTTLVAGGFDPIHEGHLAYFEAAAAFGLPVVCSIDPDIYIERKHTVLLDQAQRGKVIGALRMIDHVYLSTGTTADALRAIRPNIFVKGSDWRGRLPAAEVAVCEELGIEVRYVDVPLNSSTALVRKFTPSSEEAVSGLEAVIAHQRMPAGEVYDQEYFQGDWRTDDRYDLETRRRMEGRHPEVVKEVFAPKRVVDMGCGPGYLLHLLHEVGIHADGVDLSPSSPEMATPEVRDRIKVGSIVDIDIPDQTYDLVICREVIEHLPVVDVNRTVATMCRISSRYVYVTTRFHPAPNSLLDVTTEFEVDPTHITLLNKDFLRTLFVLQGFRRRRDLESQMDWMGKNRVLVYERGDA
jgi:glycerol-3-phosphate cytidylyltransferase-like family protein/SAM-dependent methyltransferase